MIADKYGRGWPDHYKLCPICRQPDNSGDCWHDPLTPEQVDELGGVRYGVLLGDGRMSDRPEKNQVAKNLLPEVRFRPATDIL